MTSYATHLLRLLACALAVAALPAAAEPDEDALGKSLGYPVGTSLSNWYDMPYRVGSWSALDKVPGRKGWRWKLADGETRPTHRPLILPDEPLRPRLIEKPIKIDVATVAE